MITEDWFDFMLWGELPVEDETVGGIIVIARVPKGAEEGDGVRRSSVAAATVFLGLTICKSRFGTK